MCTQSPVINVCRSFLVRYSKQEKKVWPIEVSPYWHTRYVSAKQLDTPDKPVGSYYAALDDREESGYKNTLSARFTGGLDGSVCLLRMNFFTDATGAYDYGWTVDCE
ncbi:hypothetical protein Hesp01_64970 [Herbidospora sp. NBRC 101105]|nr:hypothetical protein Hesp01_64970 [Herbidospora sp. NBRC 101105]